MPIHALDDSPIDHDLATIRIKNLRLRTHIGIKEDDILNRLEIRSPLRSPTPAARVAMPATR